MLFVTVCIIIIVALLLVLVVLAQNSKGGGLSSQFGGSGTSQLIGVKKTGDLLEKITWGLAIALLAFSLSTNLMIDPVEPAGPTSPNVERAQEQNILPNIPNSAIEGLDENAGEEGTTPVESQEGSAQDSAQ